MMSVTATPDTQLALVIPFTGTRAVATVTTGTSKCHSCDRTVQGVRIFCDPCIDAYDAGYERAL